MVDKAFGPEDFQEKVVVGLVETDYAKAGNLGIARVFLYHDLHFVKPTLVWLATEKGNF